MRSQISGSDFLLRGVGIFVSFSMSFFALFVAAECPSLCTTCLRSSWMSMFFGRCCSFVSLWMCLPWKLAPIFIASSKLSFSVWGDDRLVSLNCWWNSSPKSRISSSCDVLTIVDFPAPVYQAMMKHVCRSWLILPFRDPLLDFTLQALPFSRWP